MRSLVAEVEKYTRYVPVSITCNFCGTQYSKGDMNMQPVTEFTIEPGYGSRFDDMVMRLDICDECLNGLLDNMAVKW